MIQSKVNLLNVDKCKPRNTLENSLYVYHYYILEKIAPSFSTGFVSGFVYSFISKTNNSKQAENASMITSLLTMYAFDSSALSCLIFISVQTVLRSSGLPHKYTNYMSWMITLLSCTFGAEP